MQGRAITELEAAEVRAHLTRVALGIIEREGRDACTLRRVGALAGMSRMTPYSYFSNKEALLDSVRITALEQLSDACEKALRQGASIGDRLARVSQVSIDFALERPALYDLVFEAHAASAAHDEASARYRRLAEAPLWDGFAAGIVTLDPARLAHVLWAATHGLIALRRAGKLDGSASFHLLANDLADTLAFGFVRQFMP